MEKSNELFRFSNRWMAIIIVLQMSFNTLLYPWLIVLAPTFMQSLKMIAQVNFIYLTIIGILFGSLLALVPFRSLKYRYRFLRVTLWFIFVLQSVEMLSLLLIACMKWGLKYPI